MECCSSVPAAFYPRPSSSPLPVLYRYGTTYGSLGANSLLRFSNPGESVPRLPADSRISRWCPWDHGVLGLGGERSPLRTAKATFRKQLEVGIGEYAWDAALRSVYRKHSSDSLARLAIAQDGRKAGVRTGHDRPEVETAAESTSKPACNIVKLAHLEAFAVAGKKYPSALPSDLEPFYSYMADGGHSIIAVVSGTLDLPDPHGSLCPVPVKTILRLGWTVKDALCGATPHTLASLDYLPKQTTNSKELFWRCRGSTRLTQTFPLPSEPLEVWCYQ